MRTKTDHEPKLITTDCSRSRRCGHAPRWFLVAYRAAGGLRFQSLTLDAVGQRPWSELLLLPSVTTSTIRITASVVDGVSPDFDLGGPSVGLRGHRLSPPAQDCFCVVRLVAWTTRCRHSANTVPPRWWEPDCDVTHHCPLGPAVRAGAGCHQVAVDQANEHCGSQLATDALRAGARRAVRAAWALADSDRLRVGDLVDFRYRRYLGVGSCSSSLISSARKLTVASARLVLARR